MSRLACGYGEFRMSRLVTAWMLVLVVLGSCGGSGSTPTAISCAGSGEADPSGESDEAVSPSDAAQMSIAELLTTDPRFERFRALAEQTVSEGLGRSWLEIWEMAGIQMGDDREGVTVFVPIDAAFERLEPGLLTAIEQGQVDNELRYTLLGHHYVHRLYPSSDFEAGAQNTWRGSGVELTIQPLTWGGCPIVQTDIRVANGYIHAVDGIVMPPEVLQAATG